MNRLAKFILAVLLMLMAFAPAATALDDAGIADAIAGLSDRDITVREKATEALWAAGRATEPALKLAAQSDDPEVVRRARSVLVRFELGLYPDTRQEIIDHVMAYRDGDGVARWQAVHGLANNGNPGLRVLLGLRRLSHDDAARLTILRAIGSRPHERQGAALLLADGDIAGAESVLQHGSLEDETAVRDYAALLLMHGGLDEQIAAASAAAANNVAEFQPRRLMYFCRAKGDLAGALKAAKQCDENDPSNDVLIESRAWATLAGQYKSMPATSSERLGFTAAFCRMARDSAGLDSAAAALRTFADHNEDEYWNCAECLMLNDRVDAGVAILVEHRNYLAALDFLLARLKYKEALALNAVAREHLKSADLLQFRARSIELYLLIGDRATAERELKDIAAENQKTNDLGVWLRLVDAARELKHPTTEIDGFLAAAMAVPASGDGVAVLDKVLLPDGFPALFWWRFFRTQNLTEPYADTLSRIRNLATGKLAPAEVEALADKAGQATGQLKTIDQERGLQSIGQTLQLLGRHDAAERCFRSLVGLHPMSFTALQLLGDCQAAHGDFSAAAESYQSAWDVDRTRAEPLALRGWALLKSGLNQPGRQAVEMAHLLPFGDDIQRTSLEELFRGHDMPDDARRERELILKTGRFFSWEVCNAEHLCGNDQNSHGDYLAAADSWEIAFLRNLRKDTGFIVPIVNASVPAMIHKARAMGLMKQSPEKALAEARAAMIDTPQDADLLIDLVLAFDQAGHPHEADDLLAPSAAIYRQLCQDFPASPSAQNLLAWAEGRCRRNLDEALKHAQRAVELEPNNPDSIDTLAEVYFERADYPNAIAQASRCIELSPTVSHYKEQLAKYKAAQTAKGK